MNQRVVSFVEELNIISPTGGEIRKNINEQPDRLEIPGPDECGDGCMNKTRSSVKLVENIARGEGYETIYIYQEILDLFWLTHRCSVLLT